MKLQELINDVKTKNNGITQITVLTNNYDFVEMIDGDMATKYGDLEVNETYRERHILMAYVNAEVVGIETL
jgi:hypothetical protein